VHAAQGVVGLAADLLHLAQLGGEVQPGHLVAGRVVGAAVVDRVREAGLGQRHRRVCHHRGAVRDAGQHGLAGGVEIADDFDAEPVLLERDDGRAERGLVGQRGEAVGCFGQAHGWSFLGSLSGRPKRTLPRLVFRS
jgi:hypothetical protein